MSSKRAEAIWRRLGQWYGTRLVDQYGPKPPPDWAELFDRTDDERLEKALSTRPNDDRLVNQLAYATQEWARVTLALSAFSPRP